MTLVYNPVILTDASLPALRADKEALALSPAQLLRTSHLDSTPIKTWSSSTPLGFVLLPLLTVL